MLLGIMGQAFGEALLFAETLGLDRDKVLEMISQSGMNNGLFQAKRDMYLKEEFPSAFMLELMTKDLGLIKAVANQMNITLPLTEATTNTYLSAKENGKGNLDMASIYLELKDKNKYE